MSNSINDQALRQLFFDARSHHTWLARSVSDSTLEAIYGLMKWGPTSLNSNPGRLVFIRSTEAKQKLVPCMQGSNREQVLAAPVTAIVAYDPKFFSRLKELFPAYDATAIFRDNAQAAQETAFRNSALQGAYFIFAARALGLDVCPMSGFDPKLVDDVFFQKEKLRTNFLCTLGYGDSSKLEPRGPRLSFEDSCRLL